MYKTSGQTSFEMWGQISFRQVFQIGSLHSPEEKSKFESHIFTGFLMTVGRGGKVHVSKLY